MRTSRELIRWYASRPGGEVVEDADVTACSTGLAFRSINGGGESTSTPASADERIAEVGGWFGARGLPWRWLVGPTSRPVDLGERLVAAGLRAGRATAPGWRSTSHGLRGRSRSPAGVEIVTVDDVGRARRLGGDPAAALALDDDADRRPGATRIDRALSAEVPLRDWIACLDGVPVAAAALFVGGRRRRHLQRRDRARGSRPWHRPAR